MRSADFRRSDYHDETPLLARVLEDAETLQVLHGYFVPRGDRGVGADNDVFVESEDGRFRDWLGAQSPPLKLEDLRGEEREEMLKAFRWLRRRTEI